MLFKDYKQTEEYLTADVKDFYDTDGNELDIDNLDDESLDNFEVIQTYKHGGLLDIVFF